MKHTLRLVMPDSSDMVHSVDYSEEFYRHHAHRYAEVAHQLIQSIYIRSSHPALKGDYDLLEWLKELTPGPRGLDAGCGAGARDVYQFWLEGYDIIGIDAVEENIQTAKPLHPEIADRVSLADLRNPLDFPDESFDFIICDAVIQHIPREDAVNVTLRELARVLKRGGVLQLMFKNGRGVTTVYDRDYGVERSFQLYDEQEILQVMGDYGLSLVEPEDPNLLGGIMYFTDPKPVDHCVFYLRKGS